MNLKNSMSTPEFNANPTSSDQSPHIMSLQPNLIGLPDQMRALLEENRQLHDQITLLQSQIARMEKTESEVMMLVKAPTREKIVHDLRNVLNELVLLQAIAGQDQP
jgi:hypothetical protein